MRRAPCQRAELCDGNEASKIEDLSLGVPGIKARMGVKGGGRGRGKEAGREGEKESQANQVDPVTSLLLTPFFLP